MRIIQHHISSYHLRPKLATHGSSIKKRGLTALASFFIFIVVAVVVVAIVVLRAPTQTPTHGRGLQLPTHPYWRRILRLRCGDAIMRDFIKATGGEKVGAAEHSLTNFAVVFYFLHPLAYA